MSQNHIGDPDEKVSGMSQERTERRDWAKDREIIAAATPGPWVAVAGPMDRHWNHHIQTAWEHPQLKGPDGIVSLAMRVDCQYIYIKPTDAFLIAESRMAWPAALDEIDRLNAVVAELTTKAGVQENVIKSYDDGLFRDEVIRELAAKVQERDREIKRSQEIIIGQEEQINKQAEEIERLRAALYTVGHQIEPGTPNFCAEKMIETARSALKGAE